MFSKTRKLTFTFHAITSRYYYVMLLLRHVTITSRIICLTMRALGIPRATSISAEFPEKAENLRLSIRGVADLIISYSHKKVTRI